MSSLIQNLHLSSAELLAGNSGGHPAVGPELAISIDLSALSGAGGAETVDFTVEWSPDGTNYGPAETPDTFTQLTAAGVVSKLFTVKAPFYRLTWALSAPVQEVQAVTHDHTGGTFALSFDGQGPTDTLNWDAPKDATAAQGTLTMDTKPSDAIAAVGTLTIAEAGQNADVFTIDSQVYNLLTTPLAAYDIALGADEAATKVNIVAAINASGTEGVEYFAGTLIHPTVSAAAFSGDDSLFTARTAGVAGDSIVFTEAFAGVTNVMDGSGTLGGTTAGTAADTITIDGKTYTWQDTLTDVDGNIFIGAALSNSKLNLVAAVGLSGTAGTQYALSTTANAGVSMAAFIADDSIITSVATDATTGNAIATTETFLAGTNIFDATTLGTTTLGVSGVETELDKFSNITDVTVLRNGAGDWDVTFTLGTGDRPLITFSTDNLTGGTTTDVSETVAGESTSATFLANALLQDQA